MEIGELSRREFAKLTGAGKKTNRATPVSRH